MNKLKPNIDEIEVATFTDLSLATKEEQLAGVKQYPFSILSIKNPDREVILLAVQLEGEVLHHVGKILLSNQEFILSKDPTLIFKYTNKFSLSMRKKYKHFLTPGKAGIMDDY